ncbi:MAG: nitrile hydratase subunit beta [Alphaproteobacteria bacterium]|nr:nitrile hydratase subunit beta [Alphaproteobacteria bacterium]
MTSPRTGPYPIGAKVRVAQGLPPGHVRTPLFLRGRTGEIVRHFGDFANPERLAYGLTGLPKLHLYQVLFTMDETWEGDGAYAPGDTVAADIYETWLEPL